MKKGIWKYAALGVSAAVVASFGATGIAVANPDVNAPGPTDIQASGVSWEAPSSPLASGNTVTKDGKLYKVLNNYNGIWCKSAMEYLGVSSVMLASQNGTTGTTTYANASTSLLGIWASDINESPNAYNYNYFYNLWADTYNGGKNKSDTSVVNGAFDSSCGMLDTFKYRPEILMYAAAAQANQHKSTLANLKAGKFSTDGTTYTTDGASAFAAAHDSEYNPTVFTPTSTDASTRISNANAFTYVDTFYAWANACDNIISSTASYDSKDTDGTTVTASNVNWRNMNSLPRSNRYNESVDDCALAIEKVVKGSCYYVMKELSEGNVQKKKVAYVVNDPSDTDTTVTVVAYDFVEKTEKGQNQGMASFSPVVVDQLGATKGDNLKVVDKQDKFINNMNQSAVAYLMPYTTYTATADDLATCDYIFIQDGAYTASQWKSWIQKNLTNQKTDISDLQYVLSAPSVVMSSNFMAEKMLYGVFDVNCFYPELFPNMSLVAYYYDQCYHLKSDKVSVAMNYTMANASMPTGCSLANVDESYDVDELNSKFAEGIAFYNSVAANSAADKDGALSRIINDKMLDGTDAYVGDVTQTATATSGGGQGASATTTATYTVAANPFSASMAPSDYFETNPGKVLPKAQTIKVSPASKAFKVAKKTKKLAAKKTFTVKVTGANTALTATLNAAAKKAGVTAKVNSKAKITVTVPKNCAKGTYKITIKAKATSAYKASAAKTITVKVK